MTDRMTKSEHIALLKTAIVANLTARIEHDKRVEAERQGQPPEFKIRCFGDLKAADPDRLDLDSIIADPVRCALREQLNSLGERLYNLLGSTGPMGDIADEIAVVTSDERRRGDGAGHSDGKTPGRAARAMGAKEMMKIVEYSWTLTPEDRTGLVIECEEEGREKETGFRTEREARIAVTCIALSA